MMYFLKTTRKLGTERTKLICVHTKFNNNIVIMIIIITTVIMIVFLERLCM